MSDATTVNNTTPAELVRATPEEVACALAALEARASEEDKRVTVGEAIRQLGVDSTAEDLLAEIEVQRRQARASRLAIFGQPVTGRQHRIFQLLLIASIVLPIPIFVAIDRITTAQHSQARNAAVVAPASASIADYAPLASIPDGQRVRCDFPTLKGLAAGVVGPQVLVDTRPWRDAWTAETSTMWTLVKRGGQTFVEGWCEEEQAFRAANGHSAELTPSLLSHGEMWPPRVSVEVPIGRFRAAVPSLTSNSQDGKAIVRVKIPSASVTSP